MLKASVGEGQRVPLQGFLGMPVTRIRPKEAKCLREKVTLTDWPGVVPRGIQASGRPLASGCLRRGHETS